MKRITIVLLAVALAVGAVCCGGSDASEDDSAVIKVWKAEEGIKAGYDFYVVEVIKDGAAKYTLLKDDADGELVLNNDWALPATEGKVSLWVGNRKAEYSPVDGKLAFGGDEFDCVEETGANLSFGDDGLPSKLKIGEAAEKSVTVCNGVVLDKYAVNGEAVPVCIVWDRISNKYIPIFLNGDELEFVSDDVAREQNYETGFLALNAEGKLDFDTVFDGTTNECVNGPDHALPGKEYDAVLTLPEGMPILEKAKIAGKEYVLVKQADGVSVSTVPDEYVEKGLPEYLVYSVDGEVALGIDYVAYEGGSEFTNSGNVWYDSMDDGLRIISPFLFKINENILNDSDVSGDKIGPMSCTPKYDSGVKLIVENTDAAKPVYISFGGKVGAIVVPL